MTEVFTWPVGRAVESEYGGRTTGTPLRYVLTYVVFATAGGALTGFALAAVGSSVWALGAVPAWLVLFTAALLALTAIVLELQGRISPLPQRRAQVPRRWLAWRHQSLTAAAFGIVIGSGALTYLRHATAYALVALLLLMPSSADGALVGGLYGLVRSSTALASWTAARLGGVEIRWERLIELRDMVARGLAATSALALVAVIVAGLSSDRLL